MYGSIVVGIGRLDGGILGGLDWIWNPPGKGDRHVCEHTLETDEVASRAWGGGLRESHCLRACHGWVGAETFDQCRRLLWRQNRRDLLKKASIREGTRLGKQFNSILGGGWLRERRIL